MKAKNIMMSILLVMGSIAAKAVTGYPPELALVSQPVMVYNYNSITLYYDVENIGDYTYRGNVYIYLDPDNGYPYAEKYVRVYPGRIKRIAIEIPAYRPNPSWVYTVMPYYELGNELYSFTTFEYFEPLSIHWEGPHTGTWVVISVPPRPRHYTRPGSYRFYYDGFRPPMPPPTAHGHNTPPPMNPMHHTYGYHHSNGGYPATHNEWNNNAPDAPGTPNNSGTTPNATVRPKDNGGNSGSGSMSSGSNSGNNTGTTPPPANGANDNRRPKNNNGSASGRTGSNSNGNASGNVSRPNSGTNSSGTNNNSSGRTGNGNVNRPSSGNSNSSTGRTGNSNVGNSSNSRSSGTSNSTSGRSGSSSTRSSSSSSSSSSSNSRSSGSGRR